MRRTSILPIVILILALAVGAAGCGGSGAPAAGAETPQAILGSTLAASGDLASATGTFDVAVTLDMDTSEFPDEMKALVENPITIKGTFASDDEPQAVDADISLGFGGESMNVAFRGAGATYWMRLNGQWYETPADMMEGMDQSEQMQAKMDEMMKLITDLGVDPVTWMKDATLVGEEKLDGVETYHIKGTPDVAKMLVDVIGLTQSEEFVTMMGEAMDSAGGLGLDSMVPSPDELQEAQGMVAELFKDLVVELWVGKDDSLPRKMAMSATIMPPAGEDTQGINTIGITATISFENVNKPVSVEAPESPLPFADLEKALQENPEQFLGPLSGLFSGMGMGMGMGMDMGTY